MSVIEWSLLTSSELAAVDRRLPVVIPLGLMESHGSHLPNGTDSFTVEYVARKAAQGGNCVLGPTMHYGFEGSNFEYPGSLGVSLDTLASILEDIIHALRRQRFQKVIFLSGHGGNERAYYVTVDRISRQAIDIQCIYHNWWTLAGFGDVHHADAFESEAAAAMGVRFVKDQAIDVIMPKKWHTELSRARHSPWSGGTNGAPTQADVDRGRDHVALVVDAVRKLIEQAHDSEL